MDMRTCPPRLRHNAFVYRSDHDYAAQAGSFLRKGADAGDAIVVAGTRDRLAVMREELGSASARATFLDTGSAYARPARTIALYHRALLRELETAPHVRVIAEVQYGPTAADWREWTAYEAISNCAYAHLPAWLLCTYDGHALPDDMLEAVWRTHPDVLTEAWRESPVFEDPAALLRESAREPQPLPGLRSLRPGGDLESFRERLARELAGAGVPPQRSLELLLAATEVARNAWQHGGGLEELRVGRAHGRFVCEVADSGPGFDDPLAGYLLPEAGRNGGSGLWIARQMAWRVEMIPSESGLTVRLWA
jgi:anti-sigma regulatory factor (Ser/Thr protein kinase)